MSFIPVKIEWRRGINGDQGTYVFNPKPVLRRPRSGKRSVNLVVPLLDGVIVQNFARLEEIIQLAGVLYNKTHSWDDIETSRNNLINGLGTGPGQLHLISPQRHIRYDGQITSEGIAFDEQPRSNYQDYTIDILIPSGKEINVVDITRTITSSTEIS